MNLPNKLTLLRVILIPFFLVMMYVDAIPLHFLWALVIFAAASLTDMLDGKIARARGLVTNFGKFLDPLADKVLVITALTVFVELKEFRMSAIPLGREQHTGGHQAVCGSLGSADLVPAEPFCRRRAENL